MPPHRIGELSERHGIAEDVVARRVELPHRGQAVGLDIVFLIDRRRRVNKSVLVHSEVVIFRRHELLHPFLLLLRGDEAPQQVERRHLDFGRPEGLDKPALPVELQKAHVEALGYDKEAARLVGGDLNGTVLEVLRQDIGDGRAVYVQKTALPVGDDQSPVPSIRNQHPAVFGDEHPLRGRKIQPTVRAVGPVPLPDPTKPGVQHHDPVVAGIRDIDLVPADAQVARALERRADHRGVRHLKQVVGARRPYRIPPFVIGVIIERGFGLPPAGTGPATGRAPPRNAGISDSTHSPLSYSLMPEVPMVSSTLLSDPMNTTIGMIMISSATAQLTPVRGNPALQHLAERGGQGFSAPR